MIFAASILGVQEGYRADFYVILKVFSHLQNDTKTSFLAVSVGKERGAQNRDFWGFSIFEKVKNRSARSSRKSGKTHFQTRKINFSNRVCVLAKSGSTKRLSTSDWSLEVWMGVIRGKSVIFQSKSTCSECWGV